MYSALLIVLLLALQTFLIRPWGDFPLNDDWGHAVLTWYWAKSGQFTSFIPITPSLVLQAFVGKTLVPFFGFSHGLLRWVSLGATAVWALILDAILRKIGANQTWRWLLLTVLLLNPLVVSGAFGFMTDNFGLMVAWGGVWFWILHLGRRRDALGWVYAFLGSLLMGVSFWTRQLSVLVFGGVMLARVTMGWRKGGELAVTRRMAGYVPCTLLFLAAVQSYFVWAKNTGNLNPDFTGKIVFLPWAKIGYVPLQIFILALYATFFLLPILFLCASPTEVAKAARRKWPAALLILYALVLFVIFLTGDKTYFLVKSIHHHFPILGNVLTPYGIGPITLTDTYLTQGAKLPAFWAWPWVLFEVLLIAATAYWVVIWTRGRKLLAMGDLRAEAFLIGLYTCALVWFVNAGFFGRAVIDRYAMALLPALMLMIGTTCGELNIPRRRLYAFGAVVLAYFVYSVGGLHDYFRWNEVRWELLARAKKQGITEAEVDGGYEMNAWNYYRDYPTLPPSMACNGTFFFCGNRRYGISLDPFPGDTIVDRQPVPTFFRNFPDLLLVRRKLGDK